MLFFDPMWLILMAPVVLLAGWAQMRLQATYATAMRMPARVTGAQAARFILDHSGCQNVAVEEVGGMLSDHYDPRSKVLRLSSDVYHNQTVAAIGIAGHEAGHALQDAEGYTMMGVRNVAVRLAQFGSPLGPILIIIGFMIASSGNVQLGKPLLLAGFVGLASVVLFQVVNLPVEFDASNRAKKILWESGMIRDQESAAAVSDVLGAAAWTYVAATLQTVVVLLYYFLRFGGALRSRDDR